MLSTLRRFFPTMETSQVVSLDDQPLQAIEECYRPLFPHKKLGIKDLYRTVCKRSRLYYSDPITPTVQIGKQVSQARNSVAGPSASHGPVGGPNCGMLHIQLGTSDEGLEHQVLPQMSSPVAEPSKVPEQMDTQVLPTRSSEAGPSQFPEQMDTQVLPMRSSEAGPSEFPEQMDIQVPQTKSSEAGPSEWYEAKQHLRGMSAASSDTKYESCEDEDKVDHTSNFQAVDSHRSPRQKCGVSLACATVLPSEDDTTSEEPIRSDSPKSTRKRKAPCPPLKHSDFPPVSEQKSSTPRRIKVTFSEQKPSFQPRRNSNSSFSPNSTRQFSTPRIKVISRGPSSVPKPSSQSLKHSSLSHSSGKGPSTPKRSGTPTNSKRKMSISLNQSKFSPSSGNGTSEPRRSRVTITKRNTSSEALKRSNVSPLVGKGQSPPKRSAVTIDYDECIEVSTDAELSEGHVRTPEREGKVGSKAPYASPEQVLPMNWRYPSSETSTEEIISTVKKVRFQDGRVGEATLKTVRNLDSKGRVSRKPAQSNGKTSKPAQSKGKTGSKPAQSKGKTGSKPAQSKVKIRRGQQNLGDRVRSGKLKSGYTSEDGNEEDLDIDEEVGRYPMFHVEMKHSSVVSCFWLTIPADFSKAYMPEDNAFVVLQDTRRLNWDTNFLAGKNALSGGWRRFALDHHLKIGDICVFELIKPLKIKVHITRVSDAARAIVPIQTIGLQSSTFPDLEKVRSAAASLFSARG